MSQRRVAPTNDEFEAIRPYNDAQVQAVVARLIANRELRQTVARLVLPRLHASVPSLAQFCAGQLMGWRGRSMRTVLDFQRQMARYLDVVIRDSIDGFSQSGLDRLDPDRAYLYISNHRDIVLDSGFLNRHLHGAGFDTCQLAVGDNLFANAYAADIMRLNKSFMVERSVTGSKAIFASLSRTARYIRHCLEAGESVWIAQRGGRSKNGFDRTDPALLKMLALGYRKELGGLGELPGRLAIVPTAISYEVDPSAELKARELKQLAETGAYQKSADEDLASIAAGVTGYKGRVHFHFGKPLEPLPTAMAEGRDDADALAAALDQQIVGGLQLYPVHRFAARELARTPQPGRDDWLQQVNLEVLRTEPEGPALGRFQQQLAQLDPGLTEWVLLQYANLLRNKLECAVGDYSVVDEDGLPHAAGA